MARVLKQRLDRSAMEAANGTLLSGLNRYDKSAAPPNCPQGMQAHGARCEGALRPDSTCSFPAERAGDLCVAPGSACGPSAIPG